MTIWDPHFHLIGVPGVTPAKQLVRSGNLKRLRPPIRRRNLLLPLPALVIGGPVPCGALVLLVLLLTLARAAECCTVPVFRYALDHWEPDRYLLTAPANALENPALAPALRALRGNSPVNLELRTDAPPNSPATLTFPRSVTPVFTGPLDAATLARLTNSPARREIARRLLAGDSAVWVLVESGPREANDAKAAALTKRLKFLEQVARLPVIDPNDPTSKLGPGPALRLGFSLLRVPSAGDLQSPSLANDSNGRRLQTAGTADETPFLKMLAGPKADAELTQGPWLAVIFGRGRVLGAWPAADFGDEELEEACLFLLGACSCRVKEQNPGWDLLMNMDWAEELQAAAVKASSTPASAANPPAATPKSNPTNAAQTVTIASTAKSDAAAPKPGAPTALWLGATACALVGLFLFARRS